MGKDFFKSWAPGTSKNEEKLARLIQVVTEYQRRGFTLTLRQAYYQMVAKGFIPNSQAEYNNLGRMLGHARLAGLIDWNAIEDRGRNLMGINTWDKPQDLIDQNVSRFAIDLWARQPYRVEVWVEKQALESVIGRSASRHQCDYFACKGYGSLSEYYNAAQRLASYKASGQWPVIIHLGDHDPSGIDMTRDILDRLKMLSRGKIQVSRVALNMDQVQAYNPPPNPAKLTDSRVGAYMVKFGNKSWELDALPPDALDALISKTIDQYKDQTLWAEDVAREAALRETLKAISHNYGDVMDFLKDQGLLDVDVDPDDVPNWPALTAPEMTQMYDEAEQSDSEESEAEGDDDFDEDSED